MCLELSQATVSRLLKRAREEGLVHISISQPQGAYPELEEAIQEAYGLRDVIVADSTGDSDNDILRGIGMDLTQLRGVKRAVGIAGGARKAAAIRGALEGKWINILITDRFTAARLI